MKNHHRLGDLQEKIELLPPENLRDSLQFVIDAYGIKNCVYLGLNSQNSNFNAPYVMHTHSNAWEQRYQEQEYQKLDPVLHHGVRSLLPLDWTQLKELSPVSRLFFSDAERFGVGNQGLTVPVRSYRGELALFSISTEEKEHQWDQFREETMAELTMIAFYLHEKAMLLYREDVEDISLAPRQIEVLQWAANGKTMHDIATILNISVHTVRTYMETARYRLNALNVTHAVARAITQNLINKPD